MPVNPEACDVESYHQGCVPLAKYLPVPKCANTSFAGLPYTLGGLRVKNI